MENDPVYGRVNDGSRSHNNYNFKKTSPNLRAAGSKINTLATEVWAGKSVVGPELGDFPAVGKHPDGTCMVCKEGVHRVSRCATFSSKNLNWRRTFARQNKLCYRCLSNDHLRGKCPEKKGCTRTECTDHHTLLHITKVKGDNETTESKSASKSPESLVVHKATVDSAQRSSVLLKVVAVRVLSDNGNAITTYGLLDSAAVSSLITSDLAQKLQLQGGPEKVSINTVTHSSHACELSRVEFKIGPVDRNASSFSVCHGLTVEDLNISNQYCPNQIDLTKWPHLEGMDLPHIDVDVSKVSVLIGQDVPQAHVVLDYCWGDNPQSQPYAMKTLLWMVSGRAYWQERRRK